MPVARLTGRRRSEERSMSANSIDRMISIKRTREGDPLGFQVEVGWDVGKTEHQVTMTAATFARLTAGYNTPENVIGAVFRFLLDREPKESILISFDIAEISRYFPEFEGELPRYLPKTT
jgi:hypothetical protein